MKSIKTFAMAILLGGINNCSHANEFERYAMRFSGNQNQFLSLERVNGRRDGSEDRELSFCYPTQSDKTPCIMVPRFEVKRLQDDFVDLRRELARCRNSR